MSSVAPGYVDCHCHILPGIDDGAPDWDVSLAMARCALEEGITRVIATPHWPGDGRSSPATVRDLCGEANARFQDAGVALTVFPGHECVAEADLADHLRQGTALTLAGTRYVLVEMPYTPLPFYFKELLFRLQSAGFKPVLAHPERNPTVQEKDTTITELRQLGAAVQLNAGSLLGQFGSKPRHAAISLLRRGEVDLLSTDAHSVGERAPRLRRALAEIERFVEVAPLVSGNAASLLKGQPMRPAVAAARPAGLAGFFARFRR